MLPKTFLLSHLTGKKKKEKRTENFSQEKQTEDTVKAIKIDYIQIQDYILLCAKIFKTLFFYLNKIKSIRNTKVFIHKKLEGNQNHKFFQLVTHLNVYIQPRGLQKQNHRIIMAGKGL